MMFFTGRISSYCAILFLILASLSISIPADASVATLYRGSEALGQVPARDGDNGLAISVSDAGALLGLTASVRGEELVLRRGNDSLRIVLGSVAAWYNYQLIPLHAASYVQDGRWWLDVPSSLNLLQYFVGHGSRLRVEEAGRGMTAPTPQTRNAPVPTDRVVVDSSPARSAPAPTPATQTAQSPTSAINMLLAHTPNVSTSYICLRRK